MEETKTKNNKKMKFAALGLAAFALAGIGVASAVALGIEANHDLGAGTSVTATCQPAGVGNDITVGFSEPAYVAATTSFTVDDVVLDNIDAACVGFDYKVVVADSTGASLDEMTGTVAGATETIPASAPIASDLVGSVSVVIYSN